jgi:hypothetical protein
MLKRYAILSVVLGGVCVASPAFAQTGACPSATDLAPNPTHACGIPSSVAEHNQPANPLEAGTIASYEILFFAPGVDTATAAPVQTIAIGKPALNTSGVFWVARAELAALPVGQAYRARLVAVGATGIRSARSAESNPFGRASGTAPVAPTAIFVR